MLLLFHCQRILFIHFLPYQITNSRILHLGSIANLLIIYNMCPYLVLLCRLSDLSVQEAYPACDAYAGMVQILPVIDSDEELPAEGEPHTQEVFGKIEEGAACRNGYFVTVSTDLTGDQSAAVMLWTPFLESLAAEPGTALSAGVRDIYSTYFIGGGTPYYMTRTDGRYYLMEHRLPGHAVWSFTVADGRITDVQDLY